MNKTIPLNLFLLTNLLSYGQDKQFSLQDFHTVIQMITTSTTELGNPTKLYKS
ncbi:hypothetical protein [Tenacibaculum sp. nBUS_03]|uniref:hypothetical protein n=1 Tax=Tenacibaculum sp. nBUS_03 TaxID=3395320 RepID=UPI003EBFFF20